MLMGFGGLMADYEDARFPHVRSLLSELGNTKLETGKRTGDGEPGTFALLTLKS